MAFVLIAHRGDSDSRPENTLAAFDCALAGGFPHFETDVQLTADDQCIILHDELLGRTTRPFHTTITNTNTNKEPSIRTNNPSSISLGEDPVDDSNNTGPVASATWAQLSRLDAGSWFGDGAAYAGERIPLLSQLLERYRGRAHVHLELKSKQPGLPARVAEEVLRAGGWAAHATAPSTPPPQQHPQQQQAPPQQEQQPQAHEQPQTQRPHAQQEQPHPHFAVPGLTITSFHLPQLQRSLQLLPGVVHGWLVHELTDERIREALAAGVRQLCPRANVLTAEAVTRAVAAGLSVRAWGIKDRQLLLHAVRCGCHGATVNGPAAARQALASAAAAAAAATDPTSA